MENIIVIVIVGLAIFVIYRMFTNKDGLLDGGVLPVLKHIPGHGRATVDSHEDLPTVDTPLEVLRETGEAEQ